MTLTSSCHKHQANSSEFCVEQCQPHGPDIKLLPVRDTAMAVKDLTSSFVKDQPSFSAFCVKQWLV